jgi:hypothetical protein
VSLIDYTQGSITNNTTTNTQQLQNSNQLGGQQQANTYTPQQLSMQGLAGNFISSMLQNGGQAPIPVDTYNAARANYLFNKNVAPRIAAANGPNSPALWGAQQELNLALAQQDYMNAQQGAQTALAAAQNYGFTPVGATSQTQQFGNQAVNTQQISNQNQKSKQLSVDGGGILDFVQSTMQGLAGAGFI